MSDKTIAIKALNCRVVVQVLDQAEVVINVGSDPERVTLRLADPEKIINIPDSTREDLAVSYL